MSCPQVALGNALTSFYKFKNPTYTTPKIAYKIPLETLMSLDIFRTKNHSIVKRELIEKST